MILFYMYDLHINEPHVKWSHISMMKSRPNKAHVRRVSDAAR